MSCVTALCLECGKRLWNFDEMRDRYCRACLKRLLYETLHKCFLAELDAAPVEIKI